jgi:hypothetical protein
MNRGEIIPLNGPIHHGFERSAPPPHPLPPDGSGFLPMKNPLTYKESYVCKY